MIFGKVVCPSIQFCDIRNAINNVAGAKKLWATPDEHSDAKPNGPDPNPRAMRDSFTRAVLPLSDVEFREHYVNCLRQIRTGKLLEDLDEFAVYLCYKHTNLIGEDSKQTQRASFSVVTAQVDSILLRQSPIPTLDLHLSGFVSWVGRSSMEVTMLVEQEQGDSKRKMLSARFVMVAIDAKTRTSTAVTPIAQPINEEESEVLERGMRNHNRRLLANTQSLFKKPPDAKESAEIHELYLATLDPNKLSFKDRIKPDGDVWMKETTVKGLRICHPENRNMYGKIFGGYLMRTAYELAWAEAWAFSKTRPTCLAIDDTVFRKPVEIGSLIYVHQTIGYTEGDLLQSCVTIEVSDINDPSKRELADVFHVTFRVKLEPGRVALPRVIPNSYGETMLYLDSRRRLLATKERRDAASIF